MGLGIIIFVSMPFMSIPGIGVACCARVLPMTNTEATDPRSMRFMVIPLSRQLGKISGATTKPCRLFAAQLAMVTVEVTERQASWRRDGVDAPYSAASRCHSVVVIKRATLREDVRHAGYHNRH